MTEKNNCLWLPIAAILLIALPDILVSQATSAANSASRMQPVRPGIPGERPFWNRYARRFIYPPSFDIAAVTGARYYRFEISDQSGMNRAILNTASSSDPLTKIWPDLPAGKYNLRVYGMQLPDSSELGVAGERMFIKSPGFTWQDSLQRGMDYKAAALRCLRAIYPQPRIQHWLAAGEPNPDYALWVHPTKIMGAVVEGMTLLSRLETSPGVADSALLAARIAADFLLALRQPPDAALPYWPPTYWDGVERGKHPIYMSQIMSHYPAEGSMPLLDLFDATADSSYFNAVLRIAETYRNAQLPSGTWPQLMTIADGTAARKVMLVPVAVILLADRLKTQYGISSFDGMRSAAWQWCEENPMQTYNWQAQYEDTRPKSLYKNLSHREAAIVAGMLLDNGDTARGIELLRFVEDQFVYWHADDPAVHHQWFKKGTVWDANDPVSGNDWFTPAASEQYVFNTPIAGSTSYVLIAYLQAWRNTNSPEYLTRAIGLANTLLRAQAFHGDGEFPTHLRKRLPEANWLNVSIKAVRALLELHAALQTSTE